MSATTDSTPNREAGASEVEIKATWVGWAAGTAQRETRRVTISSTLIASTAELRALLKNVFAVADGALDTAIIKVRLPSRPKP